MRIQPVPTKTVPDWQALVDAVDSSGPVLVPPDINANAAHAALHRRGLGVRAVREAGRVVAYRIAPIKPPESA